MWITTPLEVLLSWPPQNLVNPQRRGPELWIVSGFFMSFALSAVTLRLYTRIFVRRWFGLDDALIAMALLVTIGVTASAAVGHSVYHWNVHLWDLPKTNLQGSLKTLYVARILWGLASSFVRLSVMCLYYRLLRECGGDRYRWILHCSTAYIVILMLVYLGTGVFACRPISAFWNWGGTCVNDRLSMFICAILNTSSEFLVAMLPVLAVFTLGVSPQQRWSVIGLLSLGFFVTIAGCFRTYYIHKILTTNDVSWWSVPQWICSEVEIDLALMCACATPLRPVFSRLYYRFSPYISSGTSLSTDDSELVQKHGNQQVPNNRTGAAAAEWETSLVRSVDLEGIRDDGLGYTVEIVGPRSSASSDLPIEQRRIHNGGGGDDGYSVGKWNLISSLAAWNARRRQLDNDLSSRSTGKSSKSKDSHFTAGVYEMFDKVKKGPGTRTEAVDDNIVRTTSEDGILRSGRQHGRKPSQGNMEIMARTSVRLDESYRDLSLVERAQLAGSVTGWDAESSAGPRLGAFLGERLSNEIQDGRRESEATIVNNPATPPRTFAYPGRQPTR